MQYNYPYSIDNGAGETITFLRRVKDEKGEKLEVENLVHPGSGPPMHVHHKQAESLTVVKGKIGIERPGEEPQFFGEGSTITFSAGEPHRFWNAGDEPLVCKGWIQPIDNIEYFLGAIYESTKNSTNKQPGKFDSAWLLTRYKSEFDLLVIPPFVKKVIFPVTVFFGKLARKHKKFKNAPQPVK